MTTQRDLEALVKRINKATGSPEAAIDKTPAGCRWNVGNYHLDYAYGGVCLQRTENQDGGVSDVFRCGHVTKRDLYSRMCAFLDGLTSKVAA